MADKTVNKTISYFRATFDGNAVDLERLVRRLKRKKPLVVDSEWKFGGGEILRIQHFRIEASVGTLVHLTKYVPGEHASTLTPGAKSPEENEGTQAAPTGKEFKDGDCYILVSKHDLAFVAHGITYQKAAHYFRLLFRQCNFDRATSQFDLTPATNIDKLNFIHRHGVRQISLNSNAFELSLPRRERSGLVENLFGGVIDEIKALLEKDESIAEQKALEDLIVNVNVRLDGNTRAAQESHELIEDIAETVIADDAPIEGFSIVTGSGQTVTSDEIRLHRTVKFTRAQNGLDHLLVWSELKSYLSTLKDSFLTEQ